MRARERSEGWDVGMLPGGRAVSNPTNVRGLDLTEVEKPSQVRNAVYAMCRMARSTLSHSLLRLVFPENKAPDLDALPRRPVVLLR